MLSFRREIRKISHYPLPTASLLSCDNEYTVTFGGNGVYYLNLDLGTELGIFALMYNTQSIPDRIQIIHNGVVVADTKYVGDDLVGSPPDWSGSGGLVGNNYTSVPVRIFDGTDFVADGNTEDFFVPQSDVADGITEPTDGNGTIYFLKDFVEPTQITIKILAPLTTTAVDLKTFCQSGKFQGNAVPVFLGFDATTDTTACSNFDITSGLPTANIFYMYADVGTLFGFDSAISLHSTSDLVSSVPAGYYSNGQTVRFWDGASFTSTAACP